MVYPPLPPPRENLEKKITLENSLGKEQPPSIIEGRSTVISKKMISIRKERNSETTIRSMVEKRNPQVKHPGNALTVARKVISGMSVDPRQKP